MCDDILFVYTKYWCLLKASPYLSNPVSTLSEMWVALCGLYIQFYEDIHGEVNQILDN